MTAGSPRTRGWAELSSRKQVHENGFAVVGEEGLPGYLSRGCCRMAVALTTSERSRSDHKMQGWERQEEDGNVSLPRKHRGKRAHWTPGHRRDTQKREGFWGEPGLSLSVMWPCDQVPFDCGLSSKGNFYPQ